MPDAPPPRTDAPVLPDPWAARGGIPLDGALERSEFPPFLMGFAWLVGGLVAFQGIGLVVTVVLLASKGAIGGEVAEGGMADLMGANLREIIIANSVGQVVGLGLLTLGLVRLHSTQVMAYLRVRNVDGGLLGLALAGFVFFTPVVQWLTALNQRVPLPEWMRAMDAQRLQLIEGILLGNDLSLAFTLVVLALTPALCEEVYFRGYLQRQFERSMLGTAGGVLASGILFGAYHFSGSQVLPLSALGLYLAWLTWRTGSLWPAVTVHLANNGFYAILARTVGGEGAEAAGTADLETMSLPWYIVALGLLGFAAVCYALHRRARHLQGHRALREWDRS